MLVHLMYATRVTRRSSLSRKLVDAQHYALNDRSFMLRVLVKRMLTSVPSEYRHADGMARAERNETAAEPYYGQPPVAGEYPASEREQAPAHSRAPRHAEWTLHDRVHAARAADVR